MTGAGLVGVPDPSELFGATHPGEVGAAVGCALEGTRPLLLEIQALVSPTDLAMPRRVGTGVDPKRLAMIVAVLGRHAGVGLGSADVFVNVAGGVRIEEPGADLAVALAIASAARGAPAVESVRWHSARSGSRAVLRRRLRRSGGSTSARSSGSRRSLPQQGRLPERTALESIADTLRGALAAGVSEAPDREARQAARDRDPRSDRSRARADVAVPLRACVETAIMCLVAGREHAVGAFS